MRATLLVLTSTIGLLGVAAALPQPHDCDAGTSHTTTPSTDGLEPHGIVARAPSGCRPTPLTVAGLISIAPSSAHCTTSGSYASQCRTAAQAVPAITASFEKYHISHAPVQAALIALMAYESAEFKYNHGEFPSPTEGKGTYNMQSSPYNAKYATSLGISPADGSDAMLARINAVDDDAFGSAAWFVSSQCAFSTRVALWGGSATGWEDYLTDCVGTTPNDERAEYFQRAMKVLCGV